MRSRRVTTPPSGLSTGYPSAGPFWLSPVESPISVEASPSPSAADTFVEPRQDMPVEAGQDSSALHLSRHPSTAELAAVIPFVTLSATARIRKPSGALYEVSA